MIFPNQYKVLNQNIFKKGNYSILPIRYEDRVDIMKWRNEQVYHLRQSVLLTTESQDIYFRKTVADLFNQKAPVQLLFSLLENGVLVGYGGLVHINWVDRNAEISFIMNTDFEKDHFEKYWSIYLDLIENVGFNHLNFNKLFTYAFDLRPHLYPVLEKNGYRKEAELEEHCFFDNEYRSVIIHSKLKRHIYLREARDFDVDVTYAWANNENTRRYSFNQEVIKEEEHINWFENKLKDSNCFYYLCKTEGKDIGSIRFDLKEGVAVISYLVSPDLYGCGYGKKILELGEEKIRLNQEVSEIIGYVLPQNIASCKIFAKLDYVQETEKDYLKYVKKISR